MARGKTDRGLFHDVESINHRLKESAATVALFKTIDKMNARFASAIYDLADEAIIAAGEFALSRKHLGDPATQFNISRRHFEKGMADAETSQFKAASKRAQRAIFIGDIVRLLTVLDKTGERRIPKLYQAKALALLNRAAIRNAIK